MMMFPNLVSKSHISKSCLEALHQSNSKNSSNGSVFYLKFFLPHEDDGVNPLSSDSDSDFEETVLRKKEKRKQQRKKEDMPSEPISTASSLLNILTGLLDSEVN